MNFYDEKIRNQYGDWNFSGKGCVAWGGTFFLTAFQWTKGMHDEEQWSSFPELVARMCFSSLLERASHFLARYCYDGGRLSSACVSYDLLSFADGPDLGL